MAIPCVPVAQFAFPELAMMPRILCRDRRRCMRETKTGAACTRFAVNTHAALAGTSLTSRPKSSSEFFFNPQAAAEKVKPRGKWIAGKGCVFKLVNRQPLAKWGMNRVRLRAWQQLLSTDSFSSLDTCCSRVQFSPEARGAKTR